MKISNMIFISMILVCTSCAEKEARRPVSKKSYTLADTSEQMKIINKREERKIERYIDNDSLSNYIASPNGYWFQYLQQVSEISDTPKKEDIVEFKHTVFWLMLYSL